MKKILVIILIFGGAVLFKIPEYKELNDLAIIEGIAVYYDGSTYTIYMREIIPVKSDQGISYDQKYYKAHASSIEDCYNEITTSAKKMFYLKRCKILITNLCPSEKLLNFFNIKSQNIQYSSTDDLFEKLKEI